MYLSNLENDCMPAPKDDVVSSIARQLHLNEADTAMLYDLAAKAKNSTVVSQDLPDYIMERDIVRIALRTAKDVDATDEEWQEFIASPIVQEVQNRATKSNCRKPSRLPKN